MRIGLDISVLSDSKKTGIGVYVYELIKALLKVNRKDEFVLFGFSTLETYEYLKNIEFKKYPNVEIKVIKLPAKLFRTAFISWQRLDWPPIENFIGEVDIYHSFNWYFPPQKYGKKVATIFDMTSQLFPNFHHKRTVQLEKIRLERVKKNADLIITISENSKKDFLNFSPKSNVEVVYPAVSEQFNQVMNNTEIEKVLRKYNLQKNYVLSVSTLEPRKNLEGLIKAYIKGNFKNPLIMVGAEGWKSSMVSKLIKSHQLIIPLGYIPDEDLPYIYKGARFLVYPSFYEGFGLPVLEAMKSGIPVICSNTSSLPEVGGDDVIYVDPENTADITEELVKIDQDGNLRNTMISKGIKQARNFSWKKSARKLNELYQNL